MAMSFPIPHHERATERCKRTTYSRDYIHLWSYGLQLRILLRTVETILPAYILGTVPHQLPKGVESRDLKTKPATATCVQFQPVGKKFLGRMSSNGFPAHSSSLAILPEVWCRFERALADEGGGSLA